ncbi:hypothetical protein LX32DRAFT_382207 [Colletotrichum zoysiae]|uniref:Uncharacterized protein n=1 Tax=Colletotrichum zoysiae TaxID=1216348 RepID=A0AAD9HH43_9PEZI|nr:hypothetical protein LX32DRAFT_382207 [Colletotrichum zoysiae]
MRTLKDTGGEQQPAPFVFGQYRFERCCLEKKIFEKSTLGGGGGSIFSLPCFSISSLFSYPFSSFSLAETTTTTTTSCSELVVMITIAITIVIVITSIPLPSPLSLFLSFFAHAGLFYLVEQPADDQAGQASSVLGRSTPFDLL